MLSWLDEASWELAVGFVWGGDDAWGFAEAFEHGGGVFDFDEQGVAEIDVAAAGIDGALCDFDVMELRRFDPQQGEDGSVKLLVAVIDWEEQLVDL